MDLIPGQMYRFQTRDNRVPQFGRFIRRVDDTYIFNVNGIETSSHEYVPWHAATRKWHWV